MQLTYPRGRPLVTWVATGGRSLPSSSGPWLRWSSWRPSARTVRQHYTPLFYLLSILFSCQFPDCQMFIVSISIVYLFFTACIEDYWSISGRCFSSSFLITMLFVYIQCWPLPIKSTACAALQKESVHSTQTAALMVAAQANIVRTASNQQALSSSMVGIHLSSYTGYMHRKCSASAACWSD